MEKSYTETELAAFLDYLTEKGLLNPNTAQGRKVSCMKVLSALDHHEKVDLREIDRDETFQRFVNRFGKGFNPRSLQVYKSRFNSALDDFLRYQEDPAAFKTSTAQRTGNLRIIRRERGSLTNVTPKKPDANTAPSRTSAASDPATQGGAVVFPIPLREGLVVQIHNLPHDLTRAEAARISAIVNALAVVEE